MCYLREVSARHLTDEPLRVAEPLRGAELASPARRALALALDWLLLVLPSIGVALAVALLSLRASDPAGYRGLIGLWTGRSTGPEALHATLRDIAPLLVRAEAPGLPAAVTLAVEEGDLDRAADLLAATDFMFSLSLDAHAGEAAPERGVRVEIGHFIPRALRAAALYGVAALYFTLLTRGRRGATLGKRLLGIRVARLDGHRLSLMESFERFAGYLHIPGTLGVGLLDLWHDPNRRLPHDRTVHTAVLRVRSVPRRAG
jgi:uncharacterized RDD family membrane protein YckC